VSGNKTFSHCFHCNAKVSLFAFLFTYLKICMLKWQLYKETTCRRHNKWSLCPFLFIYFLLLKLGCLVSGDKTYYSNLLSALEFLFTFMFVNILYFTIEPVHRYHSSEGCVRIQLISAPKTFKLYYYIWLHRSSKRVRGQLCLKHGHIKFSDLEEKSTLLWYFCMWIRWKCSLLIFTNSSFNDMTSPAFFI
jgi:hypothetical protein